MISPLNSQVKSQLSFCIRDIQFISYISFPPKFSGQRLEWWGDRLINY